MSDDVINRFKTHKITDANTLHWMALMRMQIAGLATEINTRLPPCREASLALTHLEKAMFWTNAGASRTMGEPVDFGESAALAAEQAERPRPLVDNCLCGRGPLQGPGIGCVECVEGARAADDKVSAALEDRDSDEPQQG